MSDWREGVGVLSYFGAWGSRAVAVAAAVAVWGVGVSAARIYLF